MVKVSVITVTYNDADNLKRTLDSLCAQNYKSIESIIIDGGSDDGSIEIINEFERKFCGEVKWVSEKDSGMYEALNKGISLSTGDIIGCLWDEYYTDDVITQIVNSIEINGVSGVHGDLIYVLDEKVKRYWKMGIGEIEQGWVPGHPTLYLRREVYNKYGMYKNKYGVYGDYEFMVRCLKDKSVKLAYIPNVLIKMNYGGASNKGIKEYIMSIKEAIIILSDLGIKHPVIVTLKRICKTAWQFKSPDI